MWKNFEINKNAIQATTAKAVLIKIPRTELSFWHPAKLIKPSFKGKHLISVGYTDNFKFVGKKTSKTTFKVLAEKTYSAQEFENHLYN